MLSTALLATAQFGHAEVVVEGVPEALASNVERHLRLASQPCEAPAWRIAQLQRTAGTEVEAALAAFSYFSPKLDLTLEQTTTCWRLTVVIDAGPQTQLAAANVEIRGEGSDVASLASIRDKYPLAIDQPLDQEQYGVLKRRLLDTAIRDGFLDASFSTHQVDVWPESATASLNLTLDTGRRAHIGQVRSRQDILDKDLFDRLVRLTPGDHYTAASVERAYQSLSSSGYFSAVRVTPNLAEREDLSVPIDIALTPARKHSYTVGGGYSSDEGARSRLGYNNRRVNTRGHQAAVGAEHATTASRLDLSYRRPLADPVNEWFSVRTGYQRKDTETSESENFQVAFRRLRSLANGWVRTEELVLLEENFEVGSIDRKTRLAVPGVAWTKQRTDNSINPRAGDSLQFSVDTALDREFSSTRFLQAYLRYVRIRPAGENGRWLARVAVGATGYEDFDRLPATYRFFAGGTESVRGYGFETLGPTDGDGFVVGGPNLIAATLEYDRPLWGQFDGAAFVDAGNAFAGDIPSLRYSVGIGLKWRSPVGPLRFYLAHPLTASDRQIRIHISMGPDL